MRLILGCGDREEARMDTVRFDVRPVGDVQGDVRDLPFDDARFGEIVAEDIFEHIPRLQAGFALREWRRVAMDKARLRVKVPDLLNLCRAVVADPNHCDEFVNIIYGGHRWGPDGAWDTHHWGYTPVTICHTLRSGGWLPVDVQSADLGMEVEAVAA